jgi:hypothetical protein
VDGIVGEQNEGMAEYIAERRAEKESHSKDILK